MKRLWNWFVVMVPLSWIEGIGIAVASAVGLQLVMTAYNADLNSWTSFHDWALSTGQMVLNVAGAAALVYWKANPLKRGANPASDTTPATPPTPPASAPGDAPTSPAPPPGA